MSHTPETPLSGKPETLIFRPEETAPDTARKDIDALAESNTPEYVKQFIAFMLAIEEASTVVDLSERKTAVMQKETALNIFLSTLQPAQLQRIDSFCKQSLAGKVVRDNQSKTNETLTRGLHWVPRVVEPVADVAVEGLRITAKVSAETLGIIANFVALALKRIGQGIGRAIAT